MSFIDTGNSANTLTRGSERLVSLQVSRQLSQSLTSKNSDLVWINDGIVPLPMLQVLQKIFPQSLQWCFRLNIEKTTPQAHCVTSSFDCHIFLDPNHYLCTPFFLKNVD